MESVALLHALGRAATRLLLAPRLRRSTAALQAYRLLYVAGKRLADRRTLALVRRHLEEGMVVLDVGANLGVYTSAFAAGVGDAGRVFAFEPDPLSRSLLRQRCRRLSNVEVVGCAAGECAGAAVLHCHRANRADNRLHDSLGSAAAEQIAVEVVSLDDFCGARGLRRVDAVKIDVQGWEVAVLRGLRETMRRAPPRWMLIELEPRLLAAAGAHAGELWDLLDAYGYDAYSLDGDAPVLPVDRDRLLGGGKRPAIDLWLRRRVHV